MLTSADAGRGCLCAPVTTLPSTHQAPSLCTPLTKPHTHTPTHTHGHTHTHTSHTPTRTEARKHLMASVSTACLGSGRQTWAKAKKTPPLQTVPLGPDTHTHTHAHTHTHTHTHVHIALDWSDS